MFRLVITLFCICRFASIVLYFYCFDQYFFLITMIAIIFVGKKTFGKTAADVLNICVEFAENITNSVANSNGGVNALSPSSSTASSSQLGKVLFDGAGLLLTKQFLILSQTLAESTAATSATANVQAMATFRLLCIIAVGLNNEQICAELLQPVRMIIVL